MRLRSIKFIDRENELSLLEEAYSSRRAELVIIYGRRRIGKTFLLSFFTRSKRAVYLVANYSEPEYALRDLVEQLCRQVDLPYTPRIDSFRDLYKLFGQLKVRVVIIDEFQRLHDSGGVTELQSAWDHHLSRSGIMLILAGSSVGMMERIGLSYESPLYGRATRILKMQELNYAAVRAFVTKYGEEDKVRVYAVFGGTPGYLALLDDSKGLVENIENLVLKPGAPLREEPRVLLSMELREPSRYLRVLEAVAGGATRLGEIADKAGVTSSEVGKYVRILERDLDLIERRYPLLEEGKRGKARYYLKDNFLKFWFSMIFPHINLLELGLYDEVSRCIQASIDAFTSHIFEQVALQHFLSLAKRGILSVSKVGKWWHRDTEIDFVAIDVKSNTAYFAEVKWSEKPLDKKVLYSLISKAEKFPWRRNTRRNIYVLYSRSGFSFSEEEDVQLYSLEDIKKDFDAIWPSVKTF
ncbi:MAG: ATP-binding protein [Thermoproteales archaeon]|nr:ATP-binding protein [Thermoproteales archaeon]